MNITQADFEKLCKYIYRKAGISISATKFENLNRKLTKMFVEKKYTDFRNFYHDLRFKPQEQLLQELINTVTVNETYFYRENHQFDILVKHTLYEIDKVKPKDKSIRILCAPCSTGEEPYSVALHILNEGKLIQNRDIEIIGVDIDSVVLQKALEGSYLKRSIQFVPPKLLKEYFIQDGFYYKISDFIKNAINFRLVNVMDKSSLIGLGKFDVIFSRNMLIYFDDVSKREVVLNFYDLLQQNGYLFLGHADNINRVSSVFKTVKIGDNLLYKKEIL